MLHHEAVVVGALISNSSWYAHGEQTLIVVCTILEQLLHKQLVLLLRPSTFALRLTRLVESVIIGIWILFDLFERNFSCFALPGYVDIL